MLVEIITRYIMPVPLYTVLIKGVVILHTPVGILSFLNFGWALYECRLNSVLRYLPHNPFTSLVQNLSGFHRRIFS